jgi:hypothetical protein
MGLELNGRARIAPHGAPVQEGAAKILLETDDLILRGGVRARVMRADVRDVHVRGGTVVVHYAGGTLTLTIGGSAAKFAEKLVEPPKSRLDKMGITAGSTVVVLGLNDPVFIAELDAAGATRTARAKASSALIVLGVHVPKDLARIATAAKSLADDGALWIVHPKGTAGVKDTDIFGAATAAGLTYTKVARFSETHTAEKLMVPKERRASGTSSGTRDK